MASKPVKDAVVARLTANWTATPILGINLLGDAPADGSEFISVQYPTANERQVGLGQIGSREFRETGTIRIIINSKRGQGTDVGDAYAVTLQSLFRAAQFSGVSCYEMTVPTEDNTNENGNYYVLTFVVVYYFAIFA